MDPPPMSATRYGPGRSSDSVAPRKLSSASSRPEMISGVYRQLIPGFSRNGPALLRERSAVDWPEKINVPLLILHGTADWRTDPKDQALAVAEKSCGA